MWSNMDWFKSYFKTHFKNLDDWYFSQTRDAYFADYRPRYPYHSKQDYTVESGANGLRLLHMTEDGFVVVADCENLTQVFIKLDNIGIGGKQCTNSVRSATSKLA